MLAAPCCHHDVATQLRRTPTPAPYTLLTRNGILRERFADTLTDAMRASVLRTLGYRVDVIDFVDSKHTPRNTLLRAVRTGGRPAEGVREELDALTRTWGVHPRLAELLDVTGWRSAAALGLGAVGLLVAAAVRRPAYGDPGHGTPLFAGLAGDDVVESSGLVDRGGTVLTTNDSGDDAVALRRRRGHGRTTTRTTYADDGHRRRGARPGRARHGVGRRHRRQPGATATTSRSTGCGPPTGTGRVKRYASLAYPDGPTNAETLLVHPRTPAGVRGDQERLRRHRVRRARAGCGPATGRTC